eukprot:CAMPEP_0118707068 /NCGR_PEP_ID=MMETSP0800-20121206/20960_1 /TAXON_ID=210618 ORGANISM="Striatella unipunctata, Strain CCMP2910" /NCGR_SAMPLE_ID=MMETSP0800 /ASSEMBLY_ACC=CAM_ASM_000638 /LENGTH=193 /DNA_ID=CAMNT_0006609777 /DNA_START=511 /DNA_END=1088 /DNA_ORIENTATION=-
MTKSRVPSATMLKEFSAFIASKTTATTKAVTRRNLMDSTTREFAQTIEKTRSGLAEIKENANFHEQAKAELAEPGFSVEDIGAIKTSHTILAQEYEKISSGGDMGDGEINASLKLVQQEWQSSMDLMEGMAFDPTAVYYIVVILFYLWALFALGIVSFLLEIVPFSSPRLPLLVAPFYFLVANNPLHFLDSLA